MKRPCLVIGNEIALRNDNGPGKDEGYEDKDKGLLQKGSIHALMVRGGALHLSPAPPSTAQALGFQSVQRRCFASPNGCLRSRTRELMEARKHGRAWMRVGMPVWH